MDEQKALNEFTYELAKEIKENLYELHGLSVETEIKSVTKTNIEKTGIAVHFRDSNVAPTIYADDIYKHCLDNDISVSEIVPKICRDIINARDNQPQLPELNPEEAKKHITLTLVNTEHNKELLNKAPHLEMLDGELSAIPRWFINDNASFVVTNEICETIGLTPDEVLRIGKDNINATTFEVKSMQDIMAEMMGGDFMDMMPPMEGPQMIVITSESRIQGANALLSDGTLDRVYDMVGGDYCILPSSIHEVICVPITDGMKPEEMRAMVKEVNMGQVAPEERLSDQVFKYNGRRLTVVKDKFNKIEIMSANRSATGHIVGKGTIDGAEFEYDYNTVLEKIKFKVEGDVDFHEVDVADTELSTQLTQSVKQKEEQQRQQRQEKAEKNNKSKGMVRKI